MHLLKKVFIKKKKITKVNMHDLLKTSKWTVFKYFRTLLTLESYMFIKAGPIRFLPSSIYKTFVSKKIGFRTEHIKFPHCLFIDVNLTSPHRNLKPFGKEPHRETRHRYEHVNHCRVCVCACACARWHGFNLGRKANEFTTLF